MNYQDAVARIVAEPSVIRHPMFGDKLIFHHGARGCCWDDGRTVRPSELPDDDRYTVESGVILPPPKGSLNPPPMPDLEPDESMKAKTFQLQGT